MQWTEKALVALPIEKGFYLRGNAMTRIETFVAAAFAFCITLVMIGGNGMPNSIQEVRAAVGLIPAFVFSGAQLIWIWYEHATWSKRYGLEDQITVLLSGILTLLVLIYVYPVRLVPPISTKASTRDNAARK